MVLSGVWQWDVVQAWSFFFETGRGYVVCKWWVMLELIGLREFFCCFFLYFKYTQWYDFKLNILTFSVYFYCVYIV